MGVRFFVSGQLVVKVQQSNDVVDLQAFAAAYAAAVLAEAAAVPLERAA